MSAADNPAAATGRRLTDALLTALPTVWAVGDTDIDVTDASLAWHLDRVAAILSGLAKMVALLGLVMVAMATDGLSLEPWRSALLPEGGAGTPPPLPGPAVLVCLIGAVILGGTGLALAPPRPGRGAAARAVPWRDALRRYALHATVAPTFCAARLIRLQREGEHGPAPCGFRGCQVTLIDPQVRCPCGRLLPGTWPGPTRPCALVCPACGRRHATTHPLLHAEAAGTLTIAHAGCPLRGACRDRTTLPVLAIVSPDRHLLVDFRAVLEQAPQPAMRDLHTALAAALAAPDPIGTPWPAGAPRFRIVVGQGAVPPQVDRVLFLAPVGLIGGESGLGLTPGEIAAALAPADSVRADRRPLPGRWQRFLSMPIASLDDGHRIVQMAVWAQASTGSASRDGTVAVLSDPPSLQQWLTHPDS